MIWKVPLVSDFWQLCFNESLHRFRLSLLGCFQFFGRLDLEILCHGVGLPLLPLRRGHEDWLAFPGIFFG